MNSTYKTKVSEITNAIQNDLKFNKLLISLRDLTQYVDYTDPTFTKTCARYIFFKQFKMIFFNEIYYFQK